MKHYGFGVDVGGTTCKLGLFTADGNLLDKWEIPTNTANGGTAILDDIAETIKGKFLSKHIHPDDVFGVGLGVPGPVLADGTVNRCINLGWGVFNVTEALSSRLGGITVRAGNDANVAALGEMWQGGGKGSQNIVMVTLGTGVGGGIVVDGRILSGVHGAAGEIGHLKMRNDETEPCGCGDTGCLEQYASATGIVRMARRRLASSPAPTVLRDFHPLTAKDVLDAAKEGDPVAVELSEELGLTLGTALANVACTVNPEVIVIGGGVSKAGVFLLDLIEKYFRTRVFHACRATRFALATLGNDAGIYGCARMLLDK